MIIEIPASEKDAHKYACTVCGLQFSWIRTEFEGVIKAHILDNSKQPSAALSYRLARVVEQRLRAEASDLEYKARVNDVLNNVVVTVEAIDDLGR